MNSRTAPEPTWSPSATAIATAGITAFRSWLTETRQLEFDSYEQLWDWSVNELDAFWSAIWEYYQVQADPGPRSVRDDRPMPDTRWFPGARLNYAEHALRHASPDRPAVVAVSEGVDPREWSWQQLTDAVARFASWLREHNVQPGDRVVGVLPNIPEAVVAFLGCAAVGAVWSCCGPDFGVSGIIDRFAQLDPVVLVTATGYRYGGRVHDRTQLVTDLRSALPGLRATVCVRYPTEQATPPGTTDWDSILSQPAPAPEFTRVDAAHPLWILFSSGTTGLPKGIIHSHAGIVLEHLKVHGLHNDLGPSDRFFWYTSTTWMMWNYVVSALLRGSTIVLYDGSPTWPDTDALFRLVDPCGITVLGTSAAYLIGCQRADVEPRRDNSLRTLRSVGSTGSPLPAHTSQWARQALGPDIPVYTASGGTDIASAFLAGCPILPVHAGEISCRALGVSVEAWDPTGKPVVDEVGELVVTRPMPSMPVGLWGDDGTRYRETYFDTFPGVWRHGDWVTITSRGGAIVHGRSDSTLNRFGVRLGTSEVYQVVDAIPEVSESLVIGLEEPDGDYRIILFVHLADGVDLDADLEARLRSTIKDNASPRHVPDTVVAMPGIPHTLTGKKLEVPIKRMLQGTSSRDAVNPAAVDDPGLIDHYLDWAQHTRNSTSSS